MLLREWIKWSYTDLSGDPKKPDGWTYDIGDAVEKRSGSQWHGRVVGFYSTDLTAEGYAIESHWERGSVQIYPVGALRPWVAPEGEGA